MEKDIEQKHWEGMKETSGLTKEQFQKMLTMDEEIMEFMEELEEWIASSRRLPSKFNFDPTLFLLWRLNKK